MPYGTVLKAEINLTGPLNSDTPKVIGHRSGLWVIQPYPHSLRPIIQTALIWDDVTFDYPGLYQFDISGQSAPDDPMFHIGSIDLEVCQSP